MYWAQSSREQLQLRALMPGQSSLASTRRADNETSAKINCQPSSGWTNGKGPIQRRRLRMLSRDAPRHVFEPELTKTAVQRQQYAVIPTPQNECPVRSVPQSA